MFINHIIHICLSSESGKAWIDFNHYDQLYLDQIKKAKKNTERKATSIGKPLQISSNMVGYFLLLFKS